MFWFVLHYSLLHESQCKMGRTGAMNANVHETKLRRNFSHGTHPIQSIGPETHVSGHFESFHYCMKVRAKLAELVPLTQKFHKRSRVGIFHNERTRSTPPHWSQKSCSGSFRTVSLHHKSRCQTGELVTLTHMSAKRSCV
jgi:hypothetical protein